MKQISQPSKLYQPQTQTFDMPPSVLRKYAGVSAAFTREAWPAGVDYTQEDGSVVSNVVLILTLQVLDANGVVVRSATQPFGGGVRTLRDGTTQLTSVWAPVWDVPQDGDVRFVVQNFVALRTAITLTMLEPGD